MPTAMAQSFQGRTGPKAELHLAGQTTEKAGTFSVQSIQALGQLAVSQRVDRHPGPAWEQLPDTCPRSWANGEHPMATPRPAERAALNATYRA